METDDIKPAAFCIGCIFMAAALGYYTGKQNRVEVVRTVYVDTNLWTHYWHVDASNEVPVGGTSQAWRLKELASDTNTYTLTISNTWIPIPRYHIPHSIAGTNIDSGPDMREINSILSNLVAEGRIELRLEQDTNRVALIEFSNKGKPMLFVYPVR